jgi:glutathione S-transferase
MLTLYHGRTSVCSVKARLALIEKGVTFESKLMTLRGDQYDPAYLELNPNAVVPTLVHDGRVIIESTVIMHYVNDAFEGPALMPTNAIARANVHMTTKLMDEHVHNCCTVLTFATANRSEMQRQTVAQFEAERAMEPSKSRSDAKRQVATLGLEAPLVAEALRTQCRLLHHIEDAMQHGTYIAGDSYSLADAAATPYLYRLEKLRLAQLWEGKPSVAAWYARMKRRPSFTVAVEDWLAPTDHDRYASFQPEPWPTVEKILGAVRT